MTDYKAVCVKCGATGSTIHVVRIVKRTISEEDFCRGCAKSAGIEGVKGILEYPTQRKRKEVFLNIDDSETINKWSNQIRIILNSDKCPDKIQKSKCRNCSYFDFCWVGED